MFGSDTLHRIRALLLFLLFPVLGEPLFISAIVNDAYARRRIRVVFGLFGLAITGIAFSASESLLYIQALSFQPACMLWLV
jgi:hypothetical protein